MKTALKISTVLSWINMIIWGIVVLIGILMALAYQSLSILVGAVLLCAVVLHSYASLQLHKSIRNPAVPLGSQTPAGVRFVGFVALFMGVTYVAYGFSMIQSTGEFLKLMQSQGEQFKALTAAQLRSVGIFVLLLGLCVAVNVFLNFRLLRWYLFRQENNK